MIKAVMDAVFGGATKEARVVAKSWTPAREAFKGGRGLYGSAGEAYLGAYSDTPRNLRLSELSKTVEQRWRAPYLVRSGATMGNPAAAQWGGASTGYDPRILSVAHGARVLDRVPSGMRGSFASMTVDEAREGFAGFSTIEAARHRGKAPVWTGQPLKTPTPSKFAGNTSNLMKNSHSTSSRRGLFTTGGMLGSVFGGLESLATGFSANRGNKIRR